MQQNTIKVIINKSIEEVFEFTINPRNTHLWIDWISEEISDKYPPKIWTQYKNRWKNTNRDYYEVVEFQENKVFTLSDLQWNYHVKYTYTSIDKNITEMIYHEWMQDWDLPNPFTEKTLLALKYIIEQK